MRRESVELAGRVLEVETGRVARLADGAVIVRQGDSMVLVTAQASSRPREGIGFLPLTVDYRERTGAAGLIPGGFLKREGRPGDHETLAARVIDRTIRPLFPKGFRHETQVMVTVLSAEPEVDPEVLALCGAGLALTLSSIPWEGPAAGVRVARRDGEWLANPTRSEREASDLDLVVAVGPDGLAMVEGELREVPEEIVLDALEFGSRAAEPMMELARRWRTEMGRPKIEFQPPEPDPTIQQLVQERVGPEIAAAMTIVSKAERQAAFQAVQARLMEPGDDGEEPPPGLTEAASRLRDRLVRERIVDQGIRIDGRDARTVRPITVETGWLPRAHGSALFTRGETQSMVTCTLAGPRERLLRNYLWGKQESRFFLHYNFPPYSVGEVRPIRGTGRREIGHGTLAQRAMTAVLPGEDEFPYTIRVVSDISESNGSSSMATVCGASLAMMDAGVPLARPVAGVAMGLIQEGDRTVVLTDILGDEDHLGDMDFKVCGTERGITALQMDNKLGSLPREVLKRALEQAREGRRHVLEAMGRVLERANPEIRPHAPQIESLWIRPSRIRDIIGPGGRIIQELQRSTDTDITVEDTGHLILLSQNREGLERARERIRELTREAEVNKVYRGRITSVKDFGAFVEIFPGTEGLVHVSEWDQGRVDRISAQPGDVILVRVLGVDDRGKIKLSRRAAMGVQPEEIVD